MDDITCSQERTKYCKRLPEIPVCKELEENDSSLHIEKPLLGNKFPKANVLERHQKLNVKKI